MRGGTTLAGGAETVATQQATQGLAAEGKAFDLAKLIAEMVIVEAGVARAG
ncbi:MAG TPA: hypothetical protein VGR97_02210 [Candidatus Acidoferrales bacterium]|nr:hypothetical protein [Candidatus Acidoferrales bacterium]